MQINLNINKNNCTKLDFSHFRKKVKAVHDPAKLTTTMLWCWEWLSLCCSVVTRVGWVVDRMFLAVSRLVTIAHIRASIIPVLRYILGPLYSVQYAG